EQPGDPVRERAGLAGPRAGQDQQWSLAEGDGLALGTVQPRQQTLDLIRPGLDRGAGRLVRRPLGRDLQFLTASAHRPRIAMRTGGSAPLEVLRAGAEKAVLSLRVAAEGALDIRLRCRLDLLRDAVDRGRRSVLARELLPRRSHERVLVEVLEALELVQLPLAVLLDECEVERLPVEDAARDGGLCGRGVPLDLDVADDDLVGDAVLGVLLTLPDGGRTLRIVRLIEEPLRLVLRADARVVPGRGGRDRLGDLARVGSAIRAAVVVAAAATPNRESRGQRGQRGSGTWCLVHRCPFGVPPSARAAVYGRRRIAVSRPPSSAPSWAAAR